MLVFENKTLRRIFVTRTDEQTGERRKLHYVELHNLHEYMDIIRMLKVRRLRGIRHTSLF